MDAKPRTAIVADWNAFLRFLELVHQSGATLEIAGRNHTGGGEWFVTYTHISELTVVPTHWRPEDA